MIINGRQLIADIRDRIAGFVEMEGYSDNKNWQQIVCGLQKAMDMIDERERRTLSTAIKDLSLDELRGLQKVTSNAIKEKEDEAKIKIWRVSDGSLVRGNFLEEDWEKANECLIKLVTERAARPGRHREYEFRIFPELINESDIGEYITD